MRKIHDIGGGPADEPFDISDRQLTDWELETYAVVGALGGKGLLSSDELRRGIESLPPEEYRRALVLRAVDSVHRGAAGGKGAS